METIYTLNVRDHIMLPVVRDHFGASTESLHKEIRRMHAETLSVLNTKGVKYSDLKTSLTPNIGKNEAGFVFDSTSINSGMYGSDIMGHILPLLDNRSSHSVLHGDFLGDDQKFIYEVLTDSMVLSRSFTFKHSTLLFCVYVNNLTEAALNLLHTELGNYKAYLGYIPATYTTIAKIYLSTTLGGAFLKYKTKVLLAHEDDRSNTENVNLTNYWFDKYGFNILSLRSTLYSLFLTYKIERPVFDKNEDDASFSINSMTSSIIPLEECEVYLEDKKYKYLISEKYGKLEKAGIANIGQSGLINTIKAKITSNYIYNLTYMKNHNVIKFNVMIELPFENGGYPTRLLVALQYLPEEKLVRVITLH